MASPANAPHCGAGEKIMITGPAPTAPADAVVGLSLHYVTFDFTYADPLGTKSGDRVIECTMSIRFSQRDDGKWNAKARTTNGMTRIAEQFERDDCGTPKVQNARRVCVEIYQYIVDRWAKMARS